MGEERETRNGAEQPPLPQMPPAAPPPSAALLVESLLFVAGEPVTVAQLARALELPADAIELALEELAASLRGRGVRVQRHADAVQLVSAPEAARAVGRFLGVQAASRLSPAALEVLAIIAYRQPITRAQVDAVRGVDSSGTVRALLARDLIAESGRLETVGRPILYTTTPAFLQQFGLTSLADLPAIELPEPPAHTLSTPSTMLSTGEVGTIMPGAEPRPPQPDAAGDVEKGLTRA